MLSIRVGDMYGRDVLINKLVELTYQRNDIDFHRGTFRVRGDSIEVIPAYERAQGIRISFFGDEVDEIKRFDVLTGQAIEALNYVTVFSSNTLYDR